MWAFQGTGRFNFRLGAGLHHLNRPNIAFSDSITSKLNRRIAIHGVAEIPSDFVQLGARVRTALDIGGNHQISAYILTVKAAFNSIMVGFVWDRYHGLPKTANAFEFSAGYILGR